MSDGEYQLPHGDILAAFAERDLFPEKTKDAKQYLKEIEKNLMMTGLEKIAQERLEQKVKHHRSIKSDHEMNPDFQLSEAAVALIAANYHFWPSDWNDDIWLKMAQKSYEDRLIIAGALIAAEIDRLNYKE